ncbi:MAG TPA: hypothetical protein VNN09_15935 [Candidatus Competibacteraceae bacterium]|nr:hypothetical protein [Candidatus Competibacteraceae bacterium]
MQTDRLPIGRILVGSADLDDYKRLAAGLRAAERRRILAGLWQRLIHPGRRPAAESRGYGPAAGSCTH